MSLKSESAICPKCNNRYPANAPAGLCPRCLLNAGFPTEPVTAGFEPPLKSELAAHFPDFEILELLGKGGMGVVYKAQQRRLDRVVAIKILPPAVGIDPMFAERFTREARTLARLNHPNIVQVFDFGQADPFFYIVMEYVDGLNLRRLVKAGDLQPDKALAIVPEICAALQFAHDAGVVHRDIKPENILLDLHGRIKIADFGLAMILDQEPSDANLTGTNQVLGTPHYMAPEQMRGSDAIDHRADIYSLGVVFYELLTGELPVGRFEPPSKRVLVDVRLDEVVLRSLESAPDRRYQQASVLKTEIESIISSEIRLPAKYLNPAKHVSLITRQLKVPAFGILFAGIVNLIATALILLLPFAASHFVEFDEGVGFVEGKATLFEASFLSAVIAICSLASGVALLLGAARMLDLQNWGLATFGAVIAILPIAIGFPIGLPFGIWALLVLSRRDVRTAFADWDSDSDRRTSAAKALSSSGEAMGLGLSFGMIAGLILGTALDPDNIGNYLVIGLILGMMAGWAIDSYHQTNSKD